MGKEFAAEVRITRKNPLDVDLIRADLEVFNIYYKHQAWRSIDEIINDRNLLVRFGNAIQGIRDKIASLFGAAPNVPPKDILRSAQNALFDRDVIEYSVLGSDDGTIYVHLYMAEWFVLLYTVYAERNLPLVGKWYTSFALERVFKKLVNEYFNPKKQPYQVEEIRFLSTEGGQPEKGMS